ncbi:MAG: helix-turn-helix domain-containing protein [Lactobacillales bacterium]|jgi:transcriptional regulator with XRE-family HTH domain|nr:helix-turn-helix domain-containing protein [Lactobacillales bacterium]
MPRAKTEKRRLFDKNMGHILRNTRNAAGLSQAKLGAKFGITAQQLQKYEQGINGISAFQLKEYSEILGVPFNLFIDGVDTLKNIINPLGCDNLKVIQGLSKLDKESADDLRCVFMYLINCMLKNNKK